MKNLTVVFMGSPEYSIPTLASLVARFGHSQVHVISNPDKAQGRGQKVAPNAVSAFAQHNQLVLHQPTQKAELIPILEAIKPDLVVVIAYGMIIPKVITDGYFCINLHASLLPAYRGASPIQSALLHGDTQTGVTLIHMNEKMDEGDMLAIAKTPLLDTETYQSLHDKLSQLSADLCMEFIQNQWSTQQICAQAQDHQAASYCQKIQTVDRELTLNQSPLDWFYRIRAFSPKPAAFVIQNGHQIKIIDATWDGQQLSIKTVQAQGKKPVSYHDYCLGKPPIQIPKH